MNNSVEIITIGDELLIGQIVDTNSARMGEILSRAGFVIKKKITVPDEKASISMAIATAFNESDVVLVTGGLGPTKDDITKKCLCEFFCTELVFDETSYQNVLRVMQGKSDYDNELNRQQAYIPKASTPIINRCGTAPILWFERMNKVLVALPGVPSEMMCAMENDILPRLTAFFETPNIIHKTLLVHGYEESSLAILLSEWESQLPSFLKLAYLPQNTLVKLRLSGIYDDRMVLEETMDKEIDKIEKILGKALLAKEDIAPEKLLTRLLEEKGMTIATAESCTGGTIASYLAKHPGSSIFYKGSVVSYCNEIKQSVLGVQSTTLETKGAVSQETVEQMAKGVLALMQTDVAISVSGIAGPGGGTPSKPVGTVWIAVADREQVKTKKLQLGEDRGKNVEKAAFEAIFFAKEFVENKK